MDELKEIIKGCIKGSRKSQDQLYRKYSSMLYGITLRYTRNKMEAEDVMQEGFVKIYNNMASYSMERSFEGWIRRIMINTAITNYRKNLKHAYQADITDVAYSKYDVSYQGNADFTQKELLAVINDLPNGYRMVFNMYVIEGYKHKEIAEMLGIDINTSKSQLSRAKKYLQRELKELSEVNLYE